MKSIVFSNDCHNISSAPFLDLAAHIFPPTQSLGTMLISKFLQVEMALPPMRHKAMSTASHSKYSAPTQSLWSKIVLDYTPLSLHLLPFIPLTSPSSLPRPFPPTGLCRVLGATWCCRSGPAWWRPPGPCGTTSARASSTARTSKGGVQAAPKHRTLQLTPLWRSEVVWRALALPTPIPAVQLPPLLCYPSE